MADIIQLNQEEIKSQLGDLVRQSVEDTLNAMLDAEADVVFCIKVEYLRAISTIWVFPVHSFMRCRRRIFFLSP